MSAQRTLRRATLAMGIAAGMLVVAAVPLLASVQSRAATTESLSVDLASSVRPATGVGEGFLYGITLDGTQPPDQLLQPLNITAYRGAGHASGGWIADGYRYGSGTQADVNDAIAQARRLTRPPYHAQYQAILSDIYGADAGQPSNTIWPCDNGDCSNWVGFIDAVVGALQNSGLTFAYDIWNEPDISAFWARGVNSTQYFQMWDTAVKEIRRIAPGAMIVGPSFAFTPQGNSGQWQTWLAHVKAAGTLPGMITNHDEGDVDDPVTVAQSINSALSSNGISPIPLSANEYQPKDRQTAGVTAWYLARFAQSGYSNAMRGNWVCCTTPNLTGILTQSGSTWSATGNWWAMRAYADLTGTLVATSGQVGSTAISASVDSANRRTVAIVGDSNGYTGDATATFSELSSQPWLAGNGAVNVVVERIPDQAPLSAPQVVLNQNMSTSGGAITVPFTFQASHDAFAIYLTPAQSTTAPPSTPPPTTAAPGACRVSYQASTWNTGFVANITVTNTGNTTINGWTLQWTWPGNRQVTNSWNATLTQTGTAVAARNVSYNATIAPGANATFGFQGTYTGTDTSPSQFILNGSACGS